MENLTSLTSSREMNFMVENKEKSKISLLRLTPRRIFRKINENSKH